MTTSDRRQPPVDLAGVELAVRMLLAAVGEDVARDGLRETPARVARSMAEQLGGYQLDAGAILAKDFDVGGDYDEMIALTAIPFYSMCEHHLEKIHGHATVVYIPNGKVVGLSKLARLVLCFAQRLQVQERLTTQIAGALAEYLSPKGYGVLIKASHHCMKARGVRLESGPMVTSAVGGLIKTDEKARHEFLRIAGL